MHCITLWDVLFNSCLIFVLHSSSRNGNFRLKGILSWYSCGYIAYFVGFSKFFVSLGLLYSYLFINKYLLPFQTRNETPELAKGATKALFDFYDVVTHELLSSDLRLVHSLSLFACALKCLLFIHSLWNLNWGCINFFFSIREQLDTWNILLRARNEGRLFSKIEWPKDPEIVSL